MANHVIRKRCAEFDSSLCVGTPHTSNNMNNIFPKTTVNYFMHLQFKFITAGKLRRIKINSRNIYKNVKFMPIFKIVFKTMWFVVAEPPELSGPHTPIVVSKTSNRRVRVPNDSRGLSGVLGKPESSTLHSFQEFPHQALQYYNISWIREIRVKAERLHNIDWNLSS